MNRDIQNTSKRIKLEVGDRSLNFAIAPEEYDAMPPSRKPKVQRDPMSHRIIEKRRRDRMNNCLADLSKLIPSNYLKQGQGRIEKTEIIEMAARHIINLQNLHNIFSEDGDPSKLDPRRCCKGKFYLGFKDCQDEVMRFFVEQEGWDAQDPLLLKAMSHLETVSRKFVEASRNELHHASNTMEKEGTCVPKEESVPHSYGYPHHQHNEMLIDMMPYPSEKKNLHELNKSFDVGCNTHLRSLLIQRDKEVASCSSGGSLSAEADNILNKAPPAQGSGSVSEGSPAESGSNQDSDNSTKANLEMDVDSGSQKNAASVYKFKHNITKRFSQEKYQCSSNNGSDSSSSSSREDEAQKMVRKPHKKWSSVASDSTGYPISDVSSNSSAERLCQMSKCSKLAGEGSTAWNSDASQMASMPAFVLHPNGTHYIPVTIVHNSSQDILNPIASSPSSSVTNAEETNKPPLVFHPISIPVNFSGPCVNMIQIGASLTMGSPPVSIKGQSTPSMSLSHSSSSSPQSSLR